MPAAEGGVAHMYIVDGVEMAVHSCLVDALGQLAGASRAFSQVDPSSRGNGASVSGTSQRATSTATILAGDELCGAMYHQVPSTLERCRTARRMAHRARGQDQGSGAFAHKTRVAC